MAQPPKVIVAKRHSPQSLGYNSWVALPFQPVSLINSMVTSDVAAQIPLGLHMKFTHLAVRIDGASGAEPTRVNVVEGTGTYETGTPSYGGALIGGTYAAGDQVILTIGGLVFRYTVTTRIATLNDLASDMADYLGTLALFNATYVAAAYGPYISISPLTYAAQTTAYSFTVVTAASGTATAQGANLIAGGAGTVPVIAPGDTTRIGRVPSLVASSGQALFPVDETIFTDASQTLSAGCLYALQAYDSIFPSRSVVTLRVATGGSASGTLYAVLYGVAVDNRPMEPQESDGIFRPSWKVL